MRHRKQKHLLGVKAPHRKALLSNLCASLITHGRIKTTLAKAKAIRPTVEKMITRAKKAKASDDPAVRLHHRRQCARHLRDKDAAHLLFNEKVDEFVDRSGGYVRIYKLGDVRLGDSAEMAIVELINADDEGYPKRRKKKPSKNKKSASAAQAEKKDSIDAPVEEETPEEKVEDAPVEDEASEESVEDAPVEEETPEDKAEDAPDEDEASEESVEESEDKEKKD